MVVRLVLVSVVVLIVSACSASKEAEPRLTKTPTPAAKESGIPSIPVSTGDIDYVVASADGASKRRIHLHGRQYSFGSDGPSLHPDGLLLIDRTREGTVGEAWGVIDPTTGRTDHRFSLVDDAGGRGELVWHEFAPGVVMGIEEEKSGRIAFHRYDLAERKLSRIVLPGRAFEKTTKSFTAYFSGAAVDGTIFVGRSEWSDFQTPGPDSVVRIGIDGSVDTILTDKHIDDLVVSADGRSLLAARAVTRPVYEGVPAVQSIVELDPKSGKVSSSMPPPPPCVNFAGRGESDSCLDRLDKVDGVVVAAVWEAQPPFDGMRADGYSTWTYVDGGWREVREQRGKMVRWQSTTGRFEQNADLQDGSGKSKLFWLDQQDKREIKGVTDNYGWEAPGSLIPSR